MIDLLHHNSYRLWLKSLRRDRAICFSKCYKLRIMLAKANSDADVTFDDMDVIVEPPWMASRRVTEAFEFGGRVMDKRFVLSL